MEIIKENVKDLQGTLKIKITESDYNEELTKQLKELRKKVNLKGFRPGHVPINVLKKLYGNQIKIDEVTKLVYKAIEDFEKENNILFVRYPILNQEQSDIKTENTEFTFVYDYAIYPNVELNFDDIKIPEYQINITDKDVEDKIETLRSIYGKEVETEEVCENCSIVIKAKELEKENGLEVDERTILYNYLTEKGKELFKNKKVSDKFQSNLKEALAEVDLASMLGVKKEDLKDISDNFEIEIVKIKKFEKADINEEFYKKVFGENEQVKDENDFREKVRKMVEEEYDFYKKDFYFESIPELLLRKFKIELPEDFIFEKYYKDVKEQDKKLIIKELQWAYIGKKLMDKYEIKVEEQDIIDYYADKLRKMYQSFMYLPADVYKLIAAQEYGKLEDKQKEEIYAGALNKKVILTFIEKTENKEKVELDTAKFNKIIADFYNWLQKDEKEDTYEYLFNLLINGIEEEEKEKAQKEEAKDQTEN